MPRILRRWSFLKTLPATLETIRAGLPKGTPIELWWQDEARVGQKNKACPREGGDRTPLGPTGNPAPGPARSEDELGLHLRGDLPATGQGRSPGPAAMRHAGHEPALGGSRAGRGSRSPWGPADGPGRMALHQGPCRARQSYAGAAASPSARVEPG